MTFEHSPVALSGVRMTQRNDHKRVSRLPIRLTERTTHESLICGKRFEHISTKGA